LEKKIKIKIKIKIKGVEKKEKKLPFLRGFAFNC